MYEGHETAERARGILGACGIDVGTDFEALNTSQVDQLIAQLELHRLSKYGPMNKLRQPLGEVGARVRSFHELLQHRASFRTARPKAV